MVENIKTPLREIKGSVLIAGVGSVRGLGAAIACRFGREGHSHRWSFRAEVGPFHEPWWSAP